MYTLNATGVHGVAQPYSIMSMNSGKDYKARETDVAQPLMAGGPVGGNQGGDFIVQPLPFDTTQITSPQNGSNPKRGDPCHPLSAGAHPPAIATQCGPIVESLAVRRLTPVECERLQGFPDGYTNIPWRGKTESPDGPRYKALGNSWAVPCAQWIGERINLVESLLPRTHIQPPLPSMLRAASEVSEAKQTKAGSDACALQPVASEGSYSQRNVLNIIEECKALFWDVSQMPLEQKVDTINQIRELLHAISPFNTEPVDFVKWIKNPSVHANDYNPNSVAPPEMELLRLSIASDGYTQPIVSMPVGDSYEVIDGFHRHRVGKECSDIQSRVHGYLPLVQIRSSQKDKNDRMAATIRHNRARGKHKVEAMSEIVVELKRRFWSDEKIAKELGMEGDEVLRLQQITGLAGLFADREFSEAWEAESFTGEVEPEMIDEA